MISDNKNEFDKSGITKWREITKDFKEIVTIVVLDDAEPPREFDKIELPIADHKKTTKGHKKQVCGVIRQCTDDNARIVAFNWFGGREQATQWIKDNAQDIDIINCSFSDTMNDELNFIRDLKIPIICSSGNKGDKSKDGLSFPSYYDWTIAIGAIEERYNRVSDYSNGGALLDAVAYTDIYIPLVEDVAKYEDTILFNGTSCAAPMATSMLYYYIKWRKNIGLPKLTNEEARTFIHKHSEDILEKGKDYSSGYGIFKLGEKPMIIKLKINSDVMNINGENVIMDTRPIIDKNNRTLVPLRAISEALGCEVQWNGQTQEITISEV